MPIASTFGLPEAMIVVLQIFLFVIWFWILITIISDLFRDHEASGWTKAFWIIFLILLPFLGALIYLIVRGKGMRDRAIAEQAEVQKQMNQYIRETAAAGSPADELQKLVELKEKGAISEEEFQSMKAKITG
ncbi:MAG: SHOCT domain-containing protein [Actinomycetes bacterium]